MPRHAFILKSVLTFFVIASIPAVSHAGIFSFVDELFAADRQTLQQNQAGTLQTIPLLEASRNPNPNAGVGGGDITVVGGSALLPEAGPLGTLVDIEENHAGTISLYVVREGDTLGTIAKMFGVSVNTIGWANDISRGVIRPGQTLVILPVSGVKHTVAKGDTLANIAKKYKADAGEIAQYNGLPENAKLAVGDEILVPDGELAQIIPTRVITSPLRGTGGPNYEGYYLRPVIGGRKTQGLHGYNGIDLGSYLGAPILSAASGQVIITREGGWNGGYGNYIVIAHDNGTQTLYAHMSALLAYEGKYVSRGEIIGYMGATGKATGVHLHFEVRGARNPF